MLRAAICAALFLAFLASAAANETHSVIVKTGAITAPEATQAAAGDERFVYAINSAAVAKYDRATGDRIATSSGSAQHLNSGFLFEGKLYCAHSNYPSKPEKSEIKVLDPDTMLLTTFKDFGPSDGSLTWVVRDGNFWWCTFAFYGSDNARTRLVKFDERWRELAAWTYPPNVVKELGNYSISGGLWKGSTLLVTGHDRPVIYGLRLPEKGDVLELLDTLRSPFPGQGLAADPKTGGLIGIDRGKKQVIFAEIQDQAVAR